MSARKRRLILVSLLAILLSVVSSCTFEEKNSPDMDKNSKHHNESMNNELPDKEHAVDHSYVPTSSFDENKVNWPRLEIYVYPKGAYYYVSVEPELAERITDDFSKGEKRGPGADDILGYTIAFSPAPGSWKFLFQNVNEEYFWGDTQISTDLGDVLIERVREATGWQLEGDPITVEGISEISIYLGAECLETITDTDNIANFETYLHQAHALGYVSKTPNYRIEICCKLEDGETVSFVTDANEDYVGIWVPPCYYYECKGTAVDLLEALGMDNWPEKIRDRKSVV